MKPAVRGRCRWPVVALGVLLVVASACTTAEGGQASVALDPTGEEGLALATAPPAGDVTAEAATPSAATSTAAAPAVTAAPDGPLAFTARRLDGGTFRGSQLAGHDVVLWMWAPWCPQCNREAPHVAAAIERFGEDVTFVGMPGHDTDRAHRAFVDKYGLGRMLHLVDDDGSLWARYGISYQPAWVFIDDDGRAEVVAGALYDGLAEHVVALIEQ